MASLSSQGGCHVWSLTGGLKEERTVFYPKQRLAAHEKYGLKCLFSPDSSLLATTSADGTVKLWSTENLTLYKTLQVMHQSEISSFYCRTLEIKKINMVIGVENRKINPCGLIQMYCSP